MDNKYYGLHPVIVNAMELAEAIRNSSAFKEKDEEKIQAIIIECNEIIMNTTKINYGLVCQPKGGCCG